MESRRRAGARRSHTTQGGRRRPLPTGCNTTLNEIEQKAKAAVQSDEIKVKSWVQRNRFWLIALAMALLLGALLGHRLH